jgi:hypothetical protein
VKYYYYLHTNGDLIGKPAIVVDSDPSHFDSPFVKKVWCIDTTNRSDAWNLLITALANGARVDRIKELAEKWGCTPGDLVEYLCHAAKPTKEQVDGLDLLMRNVLATEPRIFWAELSGAKIDQK